MHNNKIIIFGMEYDNELRKRLREVICELKGSFGDSTWGMGGSQELFQMDVSFEKSVVHIEAETFIGLSITGDAAIVDTIAARVKKK
jgi:hypothetical protein